HIFRIFSANDRNQPESINLLAQTSIHNGLTTSTFSSNAEKLRKIAIANVHTELTSKSQNH
ncbi:MAG TPA: hypothetical protein VIH61_05625, partial [Waddliaceae bacterium]